MKVESLDKKSKTEQDDPDGICKGIGMEQQQPPRAIYSTRSSAVDGLRRNPMTPASMANIATGELGCGENKEGLSIFLG